VRAGAAAVGGGRARVAAAPDGAVGRRPRDAAAEAADAPAALVGGRPAERLAAAAAGAAVRTEDTGATAADGAAAAANTTEAGLVDDAGTLPAPGVPDPPADEEVAAACAVLDAEAAADDACSALSEPGAINGGDTPSPAAGGTSPNVPRGGRLAGTKKMSASVSTEMTLSLSSVAASPDAETLSMGDPPAAAPAGGGGIPALPSAAAPDAPPVAADTCVDTLIPSRSIIFFAWCTQYAAPIAVSRINGWLKAIIIVR